jgi:hypothetical protein
LAVIPQTDEEVDEKANNPNNNKNKNIGCSRLKEFAV